MKVRIFMLALLMTFVLSNSTQAEQDKTGLAAITKEYHKLSVLLQQCSIMFPKFASSYKQHFSQWLVRNRLALKKGELDSKKLSAKLGRRFDKSVLKYQLDLKKKYSDKEQMSKDKICAYLPSIMAE